MEQSTIREAVAVFNDAEKLESAVSELQGNGIDRSELSFLAHDLAADRVPGDLRRAADDPGTPRDPVVSDKVACSVLVSRQRSQLSLPPGSRLLPAAPDGDRSRRSASGRRSRSRRHIIRTQTG
jgi:hypothetical protein